MMNAHRTTQQSDLEIFAESTPDNGSHEQYDGLSEVIADSLLRSLEALLGEIECLSVNLARVIPREFSCLTMCGIRYLRIESLF